MAMAVAEPSYVIGQDPSVKSLSWRSLLRSVADLKLSANGIVGDEALQLASAATGDRRSLLRLPSLAKMTFPSRSSYNLRAREKSRQSARCTEETTTDAKAFEHPLLPLTLKLMDMVAQPAKLLAALVRDCEGRTSKEVFWAKAAAFQQAELLALCNAWRRVIEDIDHFDLTSTDAMMVKATLYYWRLWQHVCAACVDTAAAVEEVATAPVQQEKPAAWSLPQKRPAASISPPMEDKSSDALTQGMVLSGSGLSKRSRITKTSNEFLVAWFLAHKDNPYPSPDERSDIAAKTGLQEQQVRNWFANMRKRHWKPNRANAKKPRCLLDYVLRQTD